MEKSEIESQTQKILLQVLESDYLKKGDIFVIGCSSSAVCGGLIGKNSNAEVGEIIFECANKLLNKKGIFLACQCCEHLNRALVIESECAEKFNLEEVCVVPHLKAGGAFATAAYSGFKKPVVVEHVKASAGIDIGDTLIGMHLKDVAVPIHLDQNKIGSAHVVAAFCRPKLIGGDRAIYF